MLHLIRVKLNSKKLMMDTEVTILLPALREGETAPKKRKVLWLLHGAGNDDTEWLYNTHMPDYMSERDVIVVCPSAQCSDYGVWPDYGKGYDFPAYFFGELMPMVAGFYGGSDRREDNFIAGMSMGGYGALALGLLHPEKFAGIAGLGSSMREAEYLEPYVDMTGAQFKKFAMAHKTMFRTEYGDPKVGIKDKEINVIAKYPTVQDFYDSFECMYRRFPEKLAEGNLPPIYFFVGTEDTFCEPQRRFKAYADLLGAKNVRFDFEPGYGHTDRAWDLGLQRTLEFFGL